MRELEDSEEGYSEPYDVVSSVTVAEEKCLEYENQHDGYIYFWYPIVSSED